VADDALLRALPELKERLRINVELVAAEKIGRETVQYVSNIYKYYIAYILAAAFLAVARPDE